MEMNDSREKMDEYYSQIAPEAMSNDELAYAVIYSLTSMEFYDLSDDDDDDDYGEDDHSDDDDEDEEDGYDEEEDFEEIDETLYNASFLFWEQRCKEFQFELWQRGFEAIRVHLCTGIYIPVLQQRGYNIPVETLISDFCKKCSFEQLEDLIDRLASEDNEEAYAAAAPFVAERQMRLN